MQKKYITSFNGVKIYIVRPGVNPRAESDVGANPNVKHSEPRVEPRVEHVKGGVEYAKGGVEPRVEPIIFQVPTFLENARSRISRGEDLEFNVGCPNSSTLFIIFMIWVMTWRKVKTPLISTIKMLRPFGVKLHPTFVKDVLFVFSRMTRIKMI